MDFSRSRFTDLMAPFLQPIEKLEYRQALDLLEWVEGVLQEKGTAALERKLWLLYLEETRHPRFLSALTARSETRRWALNGCFASLTMSFFRTSAKPAAGPGPTSRFSNGFDPMPLYF